MTDPIFGFSLTRARSHATVRNVRLASGLVLFAYVLTHLLNHSLGNVSLDAMEWGLEWVAGFWRRALPGLALYGALVAHASLGIWAIYARPRFEWRPSEILQLGLGLALPVLLVNHVIGTRLAYTLFGVKRSFAEQLYIFWVLSPELGVQQVVAMLAAWIHSCLGLHFWLRLKPGFPRWAPVLLCAAVLVPVLALLGYAQAGRAVLSLAQDENWLTENAPLPASASPALLAQAAALSMWRSIIMVGFLGGAAAALLGRFVRRGVARRRGLVRIAYIDGPVVHVPRGTTVLEASRLAGHPHASVCGGRGRCSTCRVQVLGGDRTDLPPPSPGEAAVLDRIGAGPHVRLACQLRPLRNVRVSPLVAPSEGLAAARRPAGPLGQERFVVAMFVDLRGSTKLAENQLPFDTVFLINRFLDAVARAVRAAGGSPNLFLGDGMLALFGLQSSPAVAAGESLAAVGRIGAEIAALNELVAGDAQEPLRFGIGVHAGLAILGQVGERESEHSVFTAIGDPVNVAARLQAATKGLGVEALISDVVYDTAGISPSTPACEVQVDGREGVIIARALTRAADVSVAAGSS